MLRKAVWLLKWARWRWIELGGGWNELNGGGWSWVELDGGKCSWLELGAQFNNTPLQHSQQYSNQNIARNWAISPNLGRKIQIYPFWLKIGAHGILEVLITNPDIDFSNSNPKIHSWANLGPNIQSYLFCLKIGTHGISRMLILTPALLFWICNQKFIFGQIWAKKVKVVCFVWKSAHMVSSVCWFLFWH